MRFDVPNKILKSYQLRCLNLALKNCRIIWLLHNVHWIWSFWNSPIICRPNFVIVDALSTYQSLLFHIFSHCVNVIMILIERFSETGFHNLRKFPLFPLPWFSQKRSLWIRSTSRIHNHYLGALFCVYLKATK